MILFESNLAHAAAYGCNICNKVFPGGVAERDYSGFDVDHWEQRTKEQHKDQMCKSVSANTGQMQNKLKSEFGTRFSVLVLLPYFVTIKMTVIDPLQNLFLGSAKRILKMWKELGYLDRGNLEKIQEHTEEFITPHDVGKIPRNIVSCFDGFNADEFKNWVLLFSLYSLRGVIPSTDMECLRKFVLACHYLCKKIISNNNVFIGHQLLLQYCKMYESLYGKDRVTPNMHLHMHLKQCILDFEPIYCFWLFSFEHYNGMLGNLPNNKRNNEPQIMHQFCTENIELNLK